MIFSDNINENDKRFIENLFIKGICKERFPIKGGTLVSIYEVEAYFYMLFTNCITCSITEIRKAEIREIEAYKKLYSR